MNDYLVKARGNAQRTLQDFTSGQRTMLGLAVVAALVGAVMLSRWAGQPDMVPLYSSLASDDAAAITDKLESAGESYELSAGGTTILVPQDRVYELRLDMSAADLPAGGGEGYSLLDKQGITTSDFQQQVTYQRALEGELTRTITAIDGVSSAVVHLAIPRKSVFVSETTDPTASVLIKTSGDKSLSTQQVQAVVHLVSASIAGMKPESVTVADSSGRVLSADGVSGGAGSSSRDDQTLAFQDRMSSSLQAMIEQVVGPGKSVVRVSADLNYDQTSRTSETFSTPDTQPGPLSESTSSEVYSGNGTAVAGVLGPDNNGVPTEGTEGDTSYERSSTTRDNAINKVVEQIRTAPGSVERLSVAVLLDSEAAAAADLAKLREAVSNAAGLQPDRGDTLTVTDVAFDTSVAEQNEAALAQVEAAQSKEQMFDLIKTGAVVVLALAVLMFLTLRGKKTRGTQVLTSAEVAELEAARAQLAGRSTTSAEQMALAPAVDIPAQRRAEVENELGEMVDRQPEEVAQLLRGWLADKGA